MLGADAPALLRVALFFAIWLGLWLPIATPLALGLNWRPSQPMTLTQKLPLLASLYLLVPLLLGGIAHLEGQSFADYGLSWNAEVVRSLGLGLLVGVAGLGGMFALQSQLGWLQWQSIRHFSPVWLTLLLGLWVGWTEELVFRGFLLNLLQQDYAPWMAGAIASLIFAVLHLLWEGQETLPQLPGLWLMGGVLVLARWADGGSLGLAWGLHAGWVWTIAALDSTEAIRYTAKVPERITGIQGKPLAGAIGIVFMALVGLSLAVLLNL